MLQPSLPLLRLKRPVRLVRLARCIVPAILLVLLYAHYSPALAQNLLVKGKMDSLISFEIEKTIQAADAARTFYLSFVVPKSYSSTTFSQVVSNFSLQFTPQPDDRRTFTDKRGNEVIEARWDTPPAAITSRITFKAANTTQLNTIHSTAPFPVQSVSGELADYLAATKQIQTGDPRFQRLAQELTAGATTQFEAVQRISEWIVDNVRYVNPPQQFDAVYSLESGKGNCQNYSHLAAVLLRILGIPVRIVNGITLDQPYDITLGGNIIRSRMGLGRHSWIEVWFPDLGWTPFNPQNTAMFIANRFIRVEVGLDNNEAVSDGKIKWVTRKGNRRPSAQEDIGSDFGRDIVSLAGLEAAGGPQQRLMLPVVDDGTKRQPPSVATIPGHNPPDSQKKTQKIPSAPPKTSPKTTPKTSPQATPKTKTKIPGPKLAKGSLLVYGNLDFPENVNFATYAEAPTNANGVMTVTRNFMVETAEYVTTHLQQYAQEVELPYAIALRDIGLALHRYGGDGTIWIDLMEDVNGKPGELIATSDFIAVSGISQKPGYRWVDFSFNPKETMLKPGKYWIGLGYTGDPILNWYFTFGKPVGPPDGTRFRDALMSDWSGALSYEFNYRVRGIMQ